MLLVWEGAFNIGTAEWLLGYMVFFGGRWGDTKAAGGLLVYIGHGLKVLGGKQIFEFVSYRRARGGHVM